MKSKKWLGINRKWWYLGSILGLFIIIITAKLIYDYEKIPRPEDYKIDVSYFQGRIFPKNYVEPGTFAIKGIDFEEIKTWGKDAIMTFGMHYISSYSHTRHFALKVWRPDSETTNVFQYTEKIFRAPNTIISSRLEGNIIYISCAKEHKDYLTILFIFSMLSLCIIICTIGFYCNYKRNTSHK